MKHFNKIVFLVVVVLSVLFVILMLTSCTRHQAEPPPAGFYWPTMKIHGTDTLRDSIYMAPVDTSI